MVTVSAPVLLVNRSRDEREMYAFALGRSGLQTVEAGSAADGWRLACAQPLAAVITDVYLPGDEDGLQFTQRLKASHHMRHVPVVIVSACTRDHDREAAVKAGCDRFLSKPCLPEDLADIITALLPAGAPHQE